MKCTYLSESIKSYFWCLATTLLPKLSVSKFMFFQAALCTPGIARNSKSQSGKQTIATLPVSAQVDLMWHSLPSRIR